MTTTITLHGTEKEKDKKLSSKHFVKSEEEDMYAHHQEKEQPDLMRDEIQYHWLNFIFKETRV